MIFDWFRRKSSARAPAVAPPRPTPEAPADFREATEAMLRDLAPFGIAPATGVSAAAIADNLHENGDGLDGEWVWWDLFHSLAEASWIHGDADPQGFRMRDFKSIEGPGSYVAFVDTLAALAGPELAITEAEDRIDALGGDSLAHWRVDGDRREVRLDGQKRLDWRLLEALQADLSTRSSRRFAIWGDGDQHAMICMEPDRIAALSRLTRLDFELPNAEETKAPG